MKTKFENYHDIQVEGVDEDYIVVSYYDNNPTNRKQIEVSGVERNIIICLGKALHKQSFLELKCN